MPYALDNATAWLSEIHRMVDALDGPDPDAAYQEIQESVLSVDVRTAWYMPGETDVPPAEFRILLTCGGPGLQIIGTLDSCGEPHTVRLEYCDMTTSWTPYPLTLDGEDYVRTFASVFAYVI